WAASCAEVILRRCPACKRDSIIGHGRRRKQAHDEHHDWIGIRRGRCPACGKTFTFLPLLSLPYTHYSLLRAVRHCDGAFWSTTPGKRPRLRLKTRIAYPILPRFAAGATDWTAPNLSIPKTRLRCKEDPPRGLDASDSAVCMSNFCYDELSM